MLETLFRNVLQVSISTSVIIGMLLLLLPLINKSYSAKWRYLVWLIIAVRLLIPFSPSIGSEPPVTIPSVSQNIQITVPLPANTNANVVPQLDNVPTQPTPVVTPNSTVVNTITLADILPIVWAIGVLAFMAYYITGYLVFRKSVMRFSEIVEDEQSLSILNQVKQQMNIRDHIDLIRSKKVQSPMITGFIRPVFLLPYVEYSEADLELIMKHELIHYKHKDVWNKLLVVAANAVHWFNPLVYVMRYRSNTDIEMACDSEVVEGSNTEFRKQYSETILSAIHRGNERGTVFSTYFYGGMKTMKERLGNIFDGGNKKKGIVALCLVIAAVIVIGTLVSCGGNGAGKEEAIDNIALLDAGYTYDLENGQFLIRYGPGYSVEVPLKPYTDNTDEYFADKGVFISDKLTAVAYGDAANPSSPVMVIVSSDKGKTWNKYEVPNTVANDYPHKYIGFSTTSDGWLVLCSDAATGHQQTRVFQTADGGRTWHEIGNPTNLYSGIVTGAAFANKKTGFISYRYLDDPDPVVYRTTDGGKTWTKCNITIPDSFKSITTYASASSLAFNGSNGVLQVTFRNNKSELKNEPVDVTVRYQTSDYGKTWTFDEKYNLALIWAQAWSTRDGRARYEIMDTKMQADFVEHNRSEEDPNVVYYVIRWSSPWVTRFEIKMEEDRALITYYYMDSGEETYKSSERITFRTENGRLVVTGCEEVEPVAEYVDTSNWKTVNTDLFTFSLPPTWEIQGSPNGMIVYFVEDGKQLGQLTVCPYDKPEPLSQLFGNHVELVRTSTLADFKYPAFNVSLKRTQPAAAGDNSYTLEQHIYVVPESSNVAFDLYVTQDRALQKLIWVAKDMTINDDRVELTLLTSKWAMAFEKRNGKALYDLMSSDLQKKVYDDFEVNHWTIGQSSPWVQDFKVEVGSDTATLTYTYMTSTGFAGYYTQVLTFSKENGHFVVSHYTEPKYLESPDKRIVIGFLKENDTYLTATLTNDYRFTDITLYINGKSHNYAWETIANSYFMPQLFYADVDKDASNELGVILCEETGTTILQERLHIINVDNFSEIPLEDPVAVLGKRVKTSITEDKVNVTIDDGEPIWFAAKGVESAFGNRNTWFPNLKIGSKIQYYVSENTLYAQVSAQISATGFLGNFILTYDYTGDKLEITNITFAPSF